MLSSEDEAACLFEEESVLLIGDSNDVEGGRALPDTGGVAVIEIDGLEGGLANLLSRSLACGEEVFAAGGSEEDPKRDE